MCCVFFHIGTQNSLFSCLILPYLFFQLTFSNRCLFSFILTTRTLHSSLIVPPAGMWSHTLLPHRAHVTDNVVCISSCSHFLDSHSRPAVVFLPRRHSTANQKGIMARFVFERSPSTRIPCFSLFYYKRKYSLVLLNFGLEYPRLDCLKQGFLLSFQRPLCTCCLYIQQDYTHTSFVPVIEQVNPSYPSSFDLILWCLAVAVKSTTGPLLSWICMCQLCRAVLAADPLQHLPWLSARCHWLP